MKQRAFALLALSLAVLSSACASYHDRVAYRTEQLPAIRVDALRGQSIAVELRDSVDRPVVKHTILHDDLEYALQQAGLRIDDSASLVLRVNQHYLASEFRNGRYQSCGHYEGRLLRDGKVIGQPFSARACVEGTPNPWDEKETVATSSNASEGGTRAYFATVSELLRRFEQVAATLPRS